MKTTPRPHRLQARTWMWAALLLMLSIGLSACLGLPGQSNLSQTLKETEASLRSTENAVASNQAPPAPVEVPATINPVADQETQLQSTALALQSTQAALALESTVQVLQATQLALQVLPTSQPAVSQPLQATPSQAESTPPSGDLQGPPAPQLEDATFLGCYSKEISKFFSQTSRRAWNPDEIVTVYFSWKPVTYSDAPVTYSYEVESSTTTPPFKVVQKGTTKDTRISLKLNCMSQYRWHVQTISNSGVAGPFSEKKSFVAKGP